MRQAEIIDNQQRQGTGTTDSIVRVSQMAYLVWSAGKSARRLLVVETEEEIMTYTKEQLERRDKSWWEYDANDRPAKVFLSFSQAMKLVVKYGRRGTTNDQKEAIAQYMLDHDTALLKAEAAILGCEDLSGEKAKNRYMEIWLTR